MQTKAVPVTVPCTLHRWTTRLVTGICYQYFAYGAIFLHCPSWHMNHGDGIDPPLAHLMNQRLGRGHSCRPRYSGCHFVQVLLGHLSRSNSQWNTMGLYDVVVEIWRIRVEYLHDTPSFGIFVLEMDAASVGGGSICAECDNSVC